MAIATPTIKTITITVSAIIPDILTIGFYLASERTFRHGRSRED
jgi:hypothetical protein